WALNLVGGLDETTALKALEHSNPQVRLWTARLLFDAGKTPTAVAAKLAQRAEVEPEVEVRCQLACSAKRLPACESLPIVAGLLARGGDVRDIHVPLLLWWAIEAKLATDADTEAVLAMFQDHATW